MFSEQRVAEPQLGAVRHVERPVRHAHDEHGSHRREPHGRADDARIAAEHARPQLMRQDHVPRRARRRLPRRGKVLGVESPSRGHRQPEEIEELLRHTVGGDLLQLRGRLDRVVEPHAVGGRRDGVGRARQRTELFGRDQAAREPAVGHRRPDGVDVAGVRVRQRAQERGVDDREERGGRGNAERQRTDRGQGERALVHQLAGDADEFARDFHRASIGESSTGILSSQPPRGDRCRKPTCCRARSIC